MVVGVDDHHEPVSSEAADVSITACPRGAHLLTWTTRGVERLYRSPLSHCGGLTAIRGGVPVLLPQFGGFGDMIKHGFARTSEWTRVEPPVEPPGPRRARLSFELEDTAETRTQWPHPFHARLDVSASADDLEMVVTVVNRGHDLARFTAGLHTYLAVADQEATITGMGGCHAWDGMSTRAPRFTKRLPDRIRALDTQDLVVHGVEAPVELHDAVLGEVRVSATGFPNRVIWNPGPESGLPDIPPGDEARFVCIEPAAVVPIILPGGGIWEGRQRLTLG
jgi:glucose-6-phosphate 1-epimerase